MVQSWMNSDGLYRKFGPDAATATTGGDYVSLATDRFVEVDINIANLTTTALIVADTTFIPAGVIIDDVKIIATTAALTITSLSVGLMKFDRTTTVSDTAFIAAMVLASIDGTGETTTLTAGSTYAGTKVGTTVGTDPGYITAKIAGSVGTGIVKVRIGYRGVPPIAH